MKRKTALAVCLIVLVIMFVGFQIFIPRHKFSIHCNDPYKNGCVTAIFEYSLRTTDGAEPLSRDGVLQWIVAAQAGAGLLEDALNTSEKIQGIDAKWWALRNIAVAQTKAGLIEDALKTARSADRQNNYRVQAVVAVAATQAESGLVEDARGIFASALRMVEEREFRTIASGALHIVSAAQVQAGLLDDALMTVERMEDDITRAFALRDVVTIQAQHQSAGDISKAFARALQAAEHAGDLGVRELVLQAIPAAQALAGFVDDALSTVERIRSPNRRDAALLGIAASQVRVGLLDDALATADRVEDAVRRITALSSIAVAQANAGILDDALRTFATALATSDTVEDAGWKKNALRTIATAEMKAGLRGDVSVVR